MSLIGSTDFKMVIIIIISVEMHPFGSRARNLSVAGLTCERFCTDCLHGSHQGCNQGGDCREVGDPVLQKGLQKPRGVTDQSPREDDHRDPCAEGFWGLLWGGWLRREMA